MPNEKSSRAQRLAEMIKEYGMEPRLSIQVEDLQFLRDLDERKLYLTAELLEEECPASEIVNPILHYNAEDDAAGIDPKDRKPIKLYISSPGGSVLDGLRIVDAITLSRTPVWTIVIGIAYSMACEIAVVGHRRFATPFSSFLIHDGGVAIVDSANKSNDLMNFNNDCRARELEMMVKHTKIPRAQLKEMERVEWYMFADRALELGLIDEIVTPEKGGLSLIV